MLCSLKRILIIINLGTKLKLKQIADERHSDKVYGT